MLIYFYETSYPSMIHSYRCFNQNYRHDPIFSAIDTTPPKAPLGVVLHHQHGRWSIVRGWRRRCKAEHTPRPCLETRILANLTKTNQWAWTQSSFQEAVNYFPFAPAIDSDLVNMSPGLGHDPLPSYNITALGKFHSTSFLKQFLHVCIILLRVLLPSGNTALCLWQQPQHILFQLANFCFALSYSAPSSRKGILFMHSVLIIGKFLCFEANVRI